MAYVQRLNAYQVDPGAYKAIAGMEKYVTSGDLEPALRELVKIRASQLNGCAFCLDMHNRDAVERGETPRRLYVVSAWREAPDLFTERERAALEFTEAVTMIASAGVPDAVWERAKGSFTEAELVQLLMAIATINVWNRVAVATHQALPEVSD